MFQFISAIIGFFSSNAANDKAANYYDMQHSAALYKKANQHINIYKTLEVITPAIILLAILIFYFKIAKKWM